MFIFIFIVLLIAIFAGKVKDVTYALDTGDILNNEATLHRRSYFYVGAEYISAGNLTVSFGQMYVEHLVPIKVIQPFPIVFIPGNGG